MRGRSARHISNCFYNRMRAKEQKNAWAHNPKAFLGLDESKADMLTLKPILGCFHGLDESQRCSTYLGLFSQSDESKRAKKTLELAIHRDKSKTVVNTLELVLSRTIRHGWKLSTYETSISKKVWKNPKLIKTTPDMSRSIGPHQGSWQTNNKERRHQTEAFL
jgi:hypothetical protein